METLGRFSLDTQHSGVDVDHLWDRGGLLRAYSREDRDGFLAELRAVVADDRGGFVTFGAACLVWEMYGGEALDYPAAWPLIDAGIEFKLARGLATASLTGYENQRLNRTRERRG
ncbi:hypothetical protein GCM10009681_06580 [Luedemannella helvata]|uniref:Uncharacterized protein n=1 Tax=Luedemannella helvata TaxID=349315 RepID=A0ABN2JTI9_9ACTN